MKVKCAMDMQDDRDVKTIPIKVAALGLWGSILLLIGVLIATFGILPIIDSVITFASIVMLIIAWFRLGFEWDDTQIKKFAGFVVLALFSISLWLLISSFMLAYFIVSKGLEDVIMQGNQANWTALWEVIKQMGLASVLLGVALYIIVLFMGLSIHKLYQRIGLLSNVKEFKTTGLIFLLGTALSIMGVGVIILLLSQFYHIVPWLKARQVNN